MNKKELDKAEDIAAVACKLQETASEEAGKRLLSEGYSYHRFDGFPGFWAFTARAGLVFNKVRSTIPPRFLDEEWIDSVDEYTDAIWADAHVLTDKELAAFARAACDARKA